MFIRDGQDASFLCLLLLLLLAEGWEDGKIERT